MPRHPYQIVCICKSELFGKDGLLLAACGPEIISVKLEDGSIASQWPSKDENQTVRAFLAKVSCSISKIDWGPLALLKVKPRD